MKDRRKRLAKAARRVVVKVGSAVLAGGRAAKPDVFTRLASEIHEVKAGGRQVALVSSGAIALGMERLGVRERPPGIPERQAVAAIGQGLLMSLYDAAFTRAGETAAQVLLTHDDLGNRKRFLNARNTLVTLLNLGIVPVINENDTVAVDEIKFGDNDELSALATNLMDADLLVILTDIDGLYDSDPRMNPGARRLPVVEDIESFDAESSAGPAGRFGTGGMRSKCDAARKAARYGAATVIADGMSPGVLTRVLAGEDAGTLILPGEDRLTGRKHWIAFSTRPSGRVFVDDGARDALLKRGKSLLPSGIRDVEGSFDSGAVVRCVDSKGAEFARGVVNYSSTEMRKIKGLKSAEIENALGYKAYDEAIHRDNLVVL